MTRAAAGEVAGAEEGAEAGAAVEAVCVGGIMKLDQKLKKCVGSGAVGSGGSDGGSSGGRGGFNSGAVATNVQESDAKRPTPDKWDEMTRLRRPQALG